MKKYTVILENGYYMELVAETMSINPKGELSFLRGSKVVAVVQSPIAWVDESIDGYWFRHL